jgi:O-antigen/teichoic acid export membrane protein
MVRALVAAKRGLTRSDQAPVRGVPLHTARLVRTAASLMSTTVLTSLLGVAFWAVAARSYSTQQVGIDAALISALMTLSTVSQLNLTNTIIRFLPRVRRVGWRVAQAYAAAAGMGVVVGVIFVFAAPAISVRYHFLVSDPALAAAFVLGLAAWTTFCLQDSVLVALGRAPWLPVENGLFSLAKIVVLPIGLLAFGSSGHGVFLAWVLPLGAAVPIVNLLIIKRVLPDVRRSRGAAGATPGVGRAGITTFVGLDLIGTVVGQLTAAAIPLIVVATLGATANAYFFLPFTLVTTVDLVFLGLATAVTAEGSRDEARTRELVRHAGRYLVAFQIPVVAAMVLFAPLLLKPFGAPYVHHGAALVRLLAAASCFRSILFVFSAVARLERRGRALLVVEGLTAVVLVGFVIAVAKHGGVNAIGVVWLAVHAGAACIVLPSLFRSVRRPPATAAPLGTNLEGT